MRRYTTQVSGPLRDRIDVNVLIPSVRSLHAGESSHAVRERVIAARNVARERFTQFPWERNSEIPPGALRIQFLPEPAGNALLNNFVGSSGGFRGSHRVLRVAWSIADLQCHSRPTKSDVALAIHLRTSETAVAA